MRLTYSAQVLRLQGAVTLLLPPTGTTGRGRDYKPQATTKNVTDVWPAYCIWEFSHLLLLYRMTDFPDRRLFEFGFVKR